MKIIHRGTVPSERTYRPTCYVCKTVFEFQEHEGKYTSDQRDGDFVSIQCPVCKGMVHASVDTAVKPS